MTLHAIIKQLEGAKGSIEKQAILDANKDDTLLKNFVKATLDPAINYYITGLPTAVGDGSCDFGQGMLNTLIDDISTRDISGHYARDYLADLNNKLTSEGRELFEILLSRKLGKSSVGSTMTLKTWPGLFFTVPYMRCASMDEKARERFDKEEYFFVQPKRDGSFAYLNTGRIVTRQGSCYPDWFVGRMSVGLSHNDVLVGEMEVYRHAATDAGIPVLLSRKEGNGILNSVLQGGEESEFEQYEFRYVAWDMLSLGEFEQGYSARPYEERLNRLFVIVTDTRLSYNIDHIELIRTERVTSVAEAKAIHTRETAAGREGTVWKIVTGVFKDTSSGSKDNVKVKVVFEAEYKVVGYFEGKGKAKGMLGGLTVETECSQLTNDCGTGFSDKQRQDLWAIREQLPGMIATLEANDISTARGKTTFSLSLPVFIELRNDRTVADTLERVLEQFEAAKLGRKLAN